MKIASIQNYNRITNTNFSFKSDEKQSLKSEQDFYINRFVRDSFERRKSNIINNASNDIVNEFQNKFIGKIYSTPRLTNIDKQVKVLDEIADVYIRDCQFDKATAITLHTMNKLYNSNLLKTKDKKSQILSDNHIYILKRFLNTTKPDNPVLDNVVNIICKTNYEEFLPMAEYLLDNEKDGISAENSSKLKKFINSHYDLDILSSFTDKSAYFQKGMCEVLSEWGLPEHIKYLTSVLNASSKDSELNHLAIKAIGMIGGSDAQKILKQYASDYSNQGKSAERRRSAILYLDPKGVSADCHSFLKQLLIDQKKMKDGFGMGGSSYGEIVTALSRYNSSDDVLLMEKYLYCGETLRTYYTIKAIGDIKSKKSKQTLLSYLSSSPYNGHIQTKNGDTNFYKELAIALTKQELSEAETQKAKNKLTELIYDSSGMNEQRREEVKSYFKFFGNSNKEPDTPKYNSKIWQQIFNNEEIEGYDLDVLPIIEKHASYNDIDYLLNNYINYDLSYYSLNSSLRPRLVAKLGKSEDINKYIKNVEKEMQTDILADYKIYKMLNSSNTFSFYNRKLIEVGKKIFPEETARYTGKTSEEANLFLSGGSDNSKTFAKIFVRGNLTWK